MTKRKPTNGEGKPIVAIDIDGTLGSYHEHFLSFAAGYLGTKMPHPEEINPGERLHKFMGVSLADYRACKLAYRQGGLKRSMPVYHWASELTHKLHLALGAEIWICTTRPYLRLDNIDPDTQEWLRRNRIHYDAVLYGEDKYRELKRQAGHRVASLIDDLPEMVHKAVKLFPNVVPILRSQPYNGHVDWPRRAPNLTIAWNMINEDLRSWREHNA